MLAEAIELAEAAFAKHTIEEEQMEREETAYQALEDELIAKYLGEYVAIYQGNLIDLDPSELALLLRLNQQYPHDVVLMRQVSDQPEPELYFRSPRLGQDNP